MCIRDRNWGSPSGLVAALERQGVRVLLGAAQASGRLDSVEEELFRFSRAVVGDPALRAALDDRNAPASARAHLVANPVSYTHLVMIAALASYGGRVTVLGLLLMLSLSNAERFAQLDPVAVVVTTVTVVFGWLGAELWVFSRLRIPTYDEPEIGTSNQG